MEWGGSSCSHRASSLPHCLILHSVGLMSKAAFSNSLTYLFSLVVHCGVDVDSADYDFRTALMLACAEGNTDVAITLMQHKVLNPWYCLSSNTCQ